MISKQTICLLVSFHVCLEIKPTFKVILVLKDHTNSAWPYNENSSGTAVSLPSRSQDSDELKADNFKSV